jgi:hypothetical protein
MALFALLIDGVYAETRDLPSRPVNIPHKLVQWFPVVEAYGDPFSGVDGDAYVVRTVDPATLPPPVPEKVSPRQARLALLASGKLDAANAAVAASDAATKIAWEFSTEIVRNDPGVIALGHAIGLSDAEIDALFIAAEVI